MKRPLVVALLAASGAWIQAQAPLKIETPAATLKFGVLVQPQYESAESLTLDGASQNLFLRRTRFLIGGTFAQNFELFLETDSPDLGKSATTGAKAASYAGLKLQDVVLTYKISENIRVDAGLLLVPSAHQSNQGATTLNGLDYGKYAFDQNGMMDTNIGRDTGMMVRGLVFNKHLEFRAGAFQGKRDGATTTNVQSRNPLRVAGRVQFNVFDAEGGLFLGGTYGGAKKILSFGAAHDRQGDYSMTAVDGFLDMPVGSDVLTAQVDHWSYKGTGFWAMDEHKALFAEASWRFNAVELAPLVRFEQKTMAAPTAAKPDETRLGLGLGWWFKGHTSNLKAYWQRVKSEAPGATLKNYNQFNVQWQLFYF